MEVIDTNTADGALVPKTNSVVFKAFITLVEYGRCSPQMHYHSSVACQAIHSIFAAVTSLRDS